MYNTHAYIVHIHTYNFPITKECVYVPLHVITYT